MKTFGKWAFLVGGFFLLTMVLASVDPSSSFAEPNNTENNNEQANAEVYKPPVFEEGCFVKKKGQEVIYRYFKNKPKDTSAWEYTGQKECPPYAK